MDRSYGPQQFLHRTRSGQQAYPHAAGAAAEVEHGWGVDNAPGQLGGRMERGSSGSANLDAYLANAGPTTAAGLHKLQHSGSFSATIPGVTRTSSSGYPSLSSSFKSAGRQPAAQQHATYSPSSSYATGAAQQQQGYLDLLDSKAGLGSGYSSAHSRSRAGLAGHSSKAMDGSAAATSSPSSSLHRAPPSPRASYGSGLLGTSTAGLGTSPVLQASSSSKLWSAGSAGPVLGRTSSSGAGQRAAAAAGVPSAAGSLGSSGTAHSSSSLLHGKLHSAGQAADSLARNSRGWLASEVTHTQSTSQRRVSQEGSGSTSGAARDPLRRSSSFSGQPPAAAAAATIGSSSGRVRHLASSSSFGQHPASDLGPAARHAGIVSHTSATTAELLAGMPGLNLSGDRVGLQGPAMTAAAAAGHWGAPTGSIHSNQQPLGRTSSSIASAAAAASGSTSYATWAVPSSQTAAIAAAKARLQAAGPPAAAVQAGGVAPGVSRQAGWQPAGGLGAGVSTTAAPSGHQAPLLDASLMHTLEATAQLLRRESQTSGELRGSAASTPSGSFTHRQPQPQPQQQQWVQEAGAAAAVGPMAAARGGSGGSQAIAAAAAAATAHHPEGPTGPSSSGTWSSRVGGGAGDEAGEMLAVGQMPEGAPISRTGSVASATHRRGGSFLGCINKPATVGSDEDEAEPVTLNSSPPRTSSRIPTPDLFKPKQQQQPPQPQPPQPQPAPKQQAPKAASKQQKPAAGAPSATSAPSSSRKGVADSAASSRTGSAKSATSSGISSRSPAAATPGTRPPPEAAVASLRKVSFTKAAAAAVSGGACDQSSPADAAVTGPAGASPAAAVAAAEVTKPLSRTASPAASLRNWFKGSKSSGGTGSSSSGGGGSVSPAPAAAGKQTAASTTSSSKAAAAKPAAKSTSKVAASSTSSKPAAAKAAAKPASGSAPAKAAASTSSTSSTSRAAAAAGAAGPKARPELQAQQQQQQAASPPMHAAVEQLQHLERSGGSFGSGSSFYTARGSLPGTAPFQTSGGGVAEEELEQHGGRLQGSAFAAAAGQGHVGHGREGSDEGLYHTGNSLSPPGSPRSPGDYVGPSWERGGAEEGRAGWAAARAPSFRIGTFVEDQEGHMDDVAEAHSLQHASGSMKEGRRTSEDSEDTTAARHRLFANSRNSSMAGRGGNSNSSSPLGPHPAKAGRSSHAVAAAAMRRSDSSASDVSSMSVSDGGSTHSAGSGGRQAGKGAMSDAGGSVSDDREDAGSCGSDGESTPVAAATAAARPARVGLQVGSTLGRRSSTRPEGCVGLSNLGNTCFMNSILQCLNCVPEFVAQMRKVTWHTGGTSGGCDPGDATSGSSSTPGTPVSKGISAASSSSSSSAPSSPLWRMGRSQSQQQQPLALQRGVGPAYVALLRQMWEVGGGPGVGGVPCVSPARLLRQVAIKDDRWGEGCQQDSQEFLTSLLEMLQAECNRVRGKPLYRELSGRGTETEQADAAAAYARSWHDSMIDDLFGGQLQSTLTCNTCGWQSHCFDPCLGVSVPIPKTRPVTVEDCLGAFVEQEQLGGSEQVKCGGKCASLQPATKKLQIYQAPKVLVLTLKRFSNSGAEYGYFSPFSKNSTPVDIPEALDLTPFCNPKAAKSRFWGGSAPKRYKLVAMSHHSGSLRGGHYTAEGRAKDGGWWDFNDEYVYAQAGAPVGPSSSAYVLFYRQQ